MRRPANLLNGMDITTLRILLAAMEEGNLARVAERESIAISAVSRRIADFEQRYGFAIFDRHDRGVTPTPDGQILLDRIMSVLIEMERIAGDLVDRRDGVAGTVRLQAHITALASGLPARLALFVEQHPGIDFLLEENTSREIIHAVQTGLCDIGLVSGTVDPRSLEVVHLEADELVAVLPAGSPLARHEVLSLADLLHEPFIGMQRDSALLSLYRTQAEAQNSRMNERVHATSFESVRLCVAAGLGVTILPAAAVRPFAEQQMLLVRKLSDSWARRPLMLCYRSKGPISAAARLLVRFLADASLGSSDTPPTAQ